MDIITRAINRNYHIKDNIQKEKHTWEAFFKTCKDKQLIIYGAGAALRYILLCKNICKKIEELAVDITVVDSDINKQGFPINWLYGEAIGTIFENIIIESPVILNNADNKVLLVTLMNGYDELIMNFSENKAFECYSLLIMESNYRSNGHTENIIDDKKLYTDYVESFSELPISGNKIVMWCGVYGAHAKSITEKLFEIKKDLDIVWPVDSCEQSVPRGVRIVNKRNIYSYIYELETSGIWICECADIPSFIKKRKGQYYIQAKHWSSITLKSFYLDDKTICVSPETEKNIKYNGQIMDYIFTGSDLDEESCRKGFGYKGPMIRIGSARSDIIFDAKIRSQIYKKFKLNDEIKTILYTPTFRMDNMKNKSELNFIPDFKNILRSVEEKFGGIWIIMLRIHPLLSFNNSGIELSDNIINVSDYSDSQELVAACDMMITDYSSIMFEPAFVRKPVFLYAPDRNEYIDKERGLLIDYDTLPFPIAETNEQLAENIRCFDNEKYVKDVDAFMEKYGVHEDGHASERAAKFISELIDNGISDKE